MGFGDGSGYYDSWDNISNERLEFMQKACLHRAGRGYPAFTARKGKLSPAVTDYRKGLY